MPDRLLHPGPHDDPTAGNASAAHSSVIQLPGRKSPANIEIGTTLGAYKVHQQLGEGGFGFVYLAEQTEPVRRKVALKILKLGMDTHQVIARFEAERQALAMMDHPNIAKVLDAGATETGRPYFVMELVKGIPITQYCDENRLAPKERLVLFMLVCNAVQHAHTKGIIHRDLKPSNILIMMQDGKPVPKVIDFGIAKAIDQKLTDKTVFTEFHQLIGTPEYMSPEQAEMSGIDIDTRSDVYSLGVLLYELLTGTTPFDAKELRRAGYGEIQRIIREVEPPKPSTRLTELISLARHGRKSLARRHHDTWHMESASGGYWRKNRRGDRRKHGADGIARNRRTEPTGLHKLLKGDLDWITMKSLEKDRTRRYETASAFEMDVLKYLCDETVSASPPTTGYRLQKFMRRNRMMLIIGGIILAVVVISTLLAGVLIIRQMDHHNRANAAAADEAALGTYLRTQQQTSEAEQHLRQSIDIRSKSLGSDKVSTITAQHDLASLLVAQGRYSEARTIFDDILSRHSKSGKDMSIRLAAITADYGHCLLRLREFDLAEQNLEKAHASLEHALGPNHPATMVTCRLIIEAYESQGQTAKVAEWRGRCK